MAIHFFTPKLLGSLLLGGGFLGLGGIIYWHQMPRTWRELLTKEGFLFLSTDEEYKAMFHDQKDGEDWKGESAVNNASEDDVQNKAKQYCNKLDEKLPTTFDGRTKKKLISFCTYAGIRTVKAKLIQNKKTGWIEEKDAENKWKAVFAVYRYNSEFINWLKEDDRDQNGDLSAETDVAQYSKLKNVCEKLLKKDYKGVSAVHIKYGSWWCVELGYKTIKGKIQQEDPDWTERGQDDNEWESLKTEWENTETVKKWASKAQDKSEIQNLTAESLKALCKKENVESQLSDNESYQEKYTVIKSVCRKRSV